MKNPIALQWSLVFLCLLASGSAAHADDKTAPDFARDIQPILKVRCYSCHDARKKTAELRLDIRSSAFRGGASGKKAIVPGHSAEGELMRRIASTNDEEVMPPSGPKLSANQIDLMRRWIEAGALWPDALAGEQKAQHWAFKAPIRPGIPAGSTSSLARNPVDRFIQARLARRECSKRRRPIVRPCCAGSPSTSLAYRQLLPKWTTSSRIIALRLTST